MKTCFKCHTEKPIISFYAHPRMSDGHLGKCKECTKKDVAANSKKNVDKIRAYDAKRFKDDPRVMARHKRYAKTDAGKESIKKSHISWMQKNPIKRSASIVVGNAVRDGKLDKCPCEVCGSVYRIHGHHDDYAKPLDVRWLCSTHHTQWHRDHGEGLNG